MAGESAREVARQAREKAERLKRRAELFELGADGEAATASVLASLPPGWIALHDVRWPGRRLANVDHVLIGPGGVFVIDSKNWSGRITIDGGHLRQNGRSREKAVAGAADAALAVSERISEYAAWVHPVLCFVDQGQLAGWSREVMVCSTDNLNGMLTTRPTVFTADHVNHLYQQLRLELPRAVSGHGRSATPRPRLARSPAAGRPSDYRRRTSKRKGPSLTRFLAGVAMLVALATVGPEIMAGLGAYVGDQVTKKFVTPACPAKPDSESKAGADGSAPGRKRSDQSQVAAGDSDPNPNC